MTAIPVAALVALSPVPAARDAAPIAEAPPLPRRKAAPSPPAEAILATLAQTHTHAIAPLTASWPDDEAFSALLVDHVLDERAPIDPALLTTLRALVARYPGCRVEIVSGFRSEKRNEAMRKKGHHVATHSQHSLGRALDFRLVPAGAKGPVDPRTLEKELREALKFSGGIGVYLAPGERFVHMDTGPRRRWSGGAS